MKVKLLCHTYDCEKLIACAAKLCYSGASIDDLVSKESEKNSSKFVNMLRQLGHESPLEHISFTFGVEQVSRALLAQVTRHRLASFSVQSQRYVVENEFSYVIPPEIEQDSGCKSVFVDFMQRASETYDQLFEFLKKKHTARFMEEGFSEKEAEQKAEKLSCEDARFVLPNACCCKFILTMNARSLLNFFKLRCCNRAQWEIRTLAFKMLRLVLEIAPTVFKSAGPNCVRNGCSEGKMSCGKSAQVRKLFKEICSECEN